MLTLGDVTITLGGGGTVEREENGHDKKKKEGHNKGRVMPNVAHHQCTITKNNA